MHTELRISETGAVLEPNFHDGYITGIAFERDRIEITLKSVEQHLYKLTLNEPSAFRVEGEHLGNIVYNLGILAGRTPPPELDFSGTWLPDPRTWSQAVADGQLTLCWNTATLGISFAALCRSVDLSFIGTATSLQPYEPGTDLLE